VKRESRLGRWITSLPPLVYLLVFFAAPAAIMLFAGFRHPGEYGGLAPLLTTTPEGTTTLNLTLGNYARLFDSPVYLQLFAKSLLYAVLSTALCLLLAYPLALVIARSNRKWRDLLVLAVILPFWSNFLVRIYAWMILLSPQGFITAALNAVRGVFGLEPTGLLFTPAAVIICLVYVHLPFMVLPLYANLEKHDPALLDAAQDLGAGAWQRFFRVTLPLSLPGITAGSTLVFIPVLGMFAVPDLIGGTRGIMIGNLIKQQFLESRDWPFGSVLSMVLTATALLLALLAALAARRKGGGNAPV
jgi:spermidine/putrescine transport system permease protein